MELDDFTSVLANVDFFLICNAEQRRLLAFASERWTIAAGDVIYARGEMADGAYVLMSGEVVIGDDTGALKGQAPYVASEPGTLLGELGLVLERPRRSGAKAKTDVELLFVPRSAFTKLLRQYPDLASRVARHMERSLQDYLRAVSKFTVPEGNGTA